MSASAPDPRSLLYVPATRPEWVAKGWGACADAVILDLEDALPPDRKSEGREAASQALAAHAAENTPSGQLWVRLNADAVEADLEAVVGPGLTGVVVPKAELELLRHVAHLLTRLEALRGVRDGSVRVTATLETALGVQRLESVASSARVTRLALGEADLAGELGLVPDDRRTQLFPVRFAVVLASAAAGLARPVGPVHTVVGDDEGLRSSSEEQLRQGFRGRTAIHPDQVAIINEAFSPTAEDVRRAHELLHAYEAGVSEGRGAVIGPSGALLDRATIRQAQDTLFRAGHGRTPEP